MIPTVFVLFGILVSYLVESYGFVSKDYNDTKCENLEGYSYSFTPDDECVYVGLFKYRGYSSMKITRDTLKRGRIIITLFNASECKEQIQWYFSEMDVCIKVDTGGVENTYEKFGKPKETDYYGYKYPEDDTCSRKENLGGAGVFDSDECLKCDCGNFYKLYCNGTTLMKDVWNNEACEGKPAETFVAHEKCDASPVEVDVFWKYSCEAIY